MCSELYGYPADIPLNVVGALNPVSAPSRYILAPVGLELTEIDPVTGAWIWRVSFTVVVFPAFTVTLCDWSLYPLNVQRTVWVPAVIPLNVFGALNPVSAPSRYILAPVGLELTEIDPVRVPGSGGSTKHSSSGLQLPLHSGTSRYTRSMCSGPYEYPRLYR